MDNLYADFDFESTYDDLLVVVDLSNDFVNGVLGTDEAKAIIPGAVEFIRNFKGDRIYTQDTHNEDYLSTQEGRRLPVIHGQAGTPGWRLVEDIEKTIDEDEGCRSIYVFRKDTFGSSQLYEHIKSLKGRYRHIYLLGTCTGICVISNAVLAKTADPEAEIVILGGLCSCVTKGSHDIALAAMSMLQMTVM